MTYESGVRGFRGSTKVMQYVELSKLGWASTAMSLASLVLLTDSAEAQQPAATLPAIEVNPPPRQRTQNRPRRQATPAPVPAAPVEEPAVQETATGPGGNPTGYRAANPGISRIPTSLLDTPQTINVVTQKVIRDQRAVTLEDALRNVPGITFQAGEGGQQGDVPVIRGFTARTDMFRDGLRDPGWYTRDLFATDRVEVYMGPSAFAFGRGATGGAINLVSKLPTGEKFLDTTISLVSPSGFRTEVDASGKQGNISGRIAAMYQDVDVQSRDNVWVKRWGAAPSITAEITDKTKLTLAHIYQGEEAVPDYGHPWRVAPTYSAATGKGLTVGANGNGTAVLPVQVPRSNFYGFTGGPFPDLMTTNTNISTAKIDHQFNPGLKIANTTRYEMVNRDATPTAPRSLGLSSQLGSTPTTLPPPPPGYPEDQMTIGRQHFQTKTDNSLLVNQTDVNANFVTGFLAHTLAAGLEISQEKRSQDRANLCAATGPAGPGVCRTSLWSPNPNGPTYGTYAGFGPITDTTQNLLAVYASDQIKVNRYWELLGSVRVDSFNTEQTTPGTTALTQNNTLLSYRVGTVFHPTDNSSIYFAYGNSYNPSAEFGTLSSSPTATNSTILDPEQTLSYEAGVKVNVLQDQLSLTGAVFRIEKTNMRIPNDPVTNTFLMLDGEAQVDGIELGAVGRITKEWGITTGYSLLDTEIKKTTNLNELGKQIPNAPPQSFTLWTTYDITSKWTVGGGALYQSDAYANTANTLYVPSFWRFDAMASYKLAANTTLQLNIYNLTNEFYYAQYYQGHAVPVAGRFAALSLRVRW